MKTPHVTKPIPTLKSALRLLAQGLVLPALCAAMLCVPTTAHAWTLWWQHNCGSVASWTMDTNYLLQVDSVAKVDSAWHIVGASDTDEYNQAAIYWQHDSGYLACWQMQDRTNCVAVSALVPGKVDPAWKLRGTWDSGAEPLPDLLWQNTNNGAVAVWHVWYHTNCLKCEALNPPKVDPSWKIAGSGYFDTEGYCDILWQHKDGWLALWAMEGTNCVVCTPLNPPKVDPSWKIVGTTDLNGDGQSEIIWRNDNGAVAYWVMKDWTNCASVGLLGSGRVDSAWKCAGPK